MAPPINITELRSVCVVTGPTKGLGRSIVMRFAKVLPKGSLFILLARSEELLSEVSGAINACDGMRAVTAVFDQGSTNQGLFDSLFIDCLKKAGTDFSISSFDQAILINNAGTLDPLDFARNIDDLKTITKYFEVNLTGCVALTAKFLQTFPSSVVKQRFICNISSLAAVSPLKSWLLYSMGKAAKDIMLKVVGAEEENIRTLNYAPGPLPTNMTDFACLETKDPELQKWFQDCKDNQKYVAIEDSVSKFMEILKKNTFENGAHIDFYDEI